MERYFLVMYIANSTKGDVTGCNTIKTNGCYINQKSETYIIKHDERELIDIVLTNIIELTKQDYEDWIKK